MAKSKKIQEQDEWVAFDLNLTLSAFTVNIKHVRQLTKLVHCLVFSYERDGLVFYDQIGTWREVNGMRKKKRLFTASKHILDNLKDRKYNRWYFTDHLCLYPMQMTKLDELLEHFSILLDDEHRSHSHLAFPLKETPFIRKKPLVQVRPMKVSFGDPLIVRQQKDTA